MWQDYLKEANVSIHVIATGAGASFQDQLWSVPGSSAYLSGASFPYSPEEQEDLLGFKPEHFCSEEAAVDLASLAYMKAYSFGSKDPIGIGLTASVASEKIHRGEHRVYLSIITNDKVWSLHQSLDKRSGFYARIADGLFCRDLAFNMLLDALGYPINRYMDDSLAGYNDATALAKERLFARPFFASSGQRLAQFPESKHRAIMPGAYNPPHEGHLGTAQVVLDQYNRRVTFEITAETPHKDPLSIQDMLKRAKLLRGYDRLFTKQDAYYIDKARKFPKTPIVLGADAMIRILDPKWGINIDTMLQEFLDLETTLLVAGRDVNGIFTSHEDICRSLSFERALAFTKVSAPVSGEWHISSTDIRNKLL